MLAKKSWAKTWREKDQGLEFRSIGVTLPHFRPCCYVTATFAASDPFCLQSLIMNGRRSHA
jgi:hypothetical protein